MAKKMSPKVTFYFFNLIVTLESLNFLYFSRCYVLEHHLSFPKQVCSTNLAVKRLRKKIFKKLQKTSCYLNVPKSNALQLAITFERIGRFYFYKYQIKAYLLPLKSLTKFH